MRSALCMIGLLVLLTVALPARAELEWKHTQESLVVRPGDTEGTAQFHFVNTGKAAVEITRVETGCGCTTVKLGRTKFAPGEAGVIPVTFQAAGREGEVRVQISVYTDDATQPVQLALVASMETPVRVDPRFVFWKSDEPRDAKRVHLTALPEFEVEFTGLQSSNPAFGVRLDPVTGKKGECELVIMPPEAPGAYSTVTFRALFGPQRTPKLYTIIARTL